MIWLAFSGLGIWQPCADENRRQRPEANTVAEKALLAAAAVPTMRAAAESSARNR